MADTGRANTSEPQPTGRRRCRDRSRGAVLVEAAIIFPVLALLTFGAIEFGFVFHDELIITTAARSGARIGTTDKNTAGTAVNPDDDYQILQAVYSALGSLSNKVVNVSVYDAGPAGSGPPAGCSGTGATGVSGVCDTFPQSDLSEPQSYWTGATPPPEEQNWPYSSRVLTLNTSAGTEPTYLGVAVTTTHTYITGLFGSSRTLTEYSVFRFEPNDNTNRAHPVAPLTETTTTTTAAPTTTLPTTTTTAGPTTTHAPTTSTTHAPTTTAAPTTTHAPTTSTTHAPTTTAAPTTTHAPTTTTSTTSGPTTTAPIIIPT